jgi:hypothetical protein
LQEHGIFVRRKGHSRCVAVVSVGRFHIHHGTKQDNPDLQAIVHLLSGICSAERKGISTNNWLTLREIFRCQRAQVL